MSWSDIYPILEDEMVTFYESHSTELERNELGEWLEVSKQLNGRQANHRVVASLFWKNLYVTEDDLVVTSKEQMQHADDLGLVSRYPPWEHYVKPLLEAAAILKTSRPDVVLRVYLAADLDFLIDDLVRADCEVMLMKCSSIRHNPGALWRFLALGNENEWITVIDADRGKDVLADVERSEKTMSAGFGIWRVPYFFDAQDHNHDPGFYRPINACQFGMKGGLPIAPLLKSFIWHNRNNTMPTNWLDLGSQLKEKPIVATEWPSYGFDEWFLLAAIYPRLSFDGVLTMFHFDYPKPSFSHLLDIEYVTWANSKSEMRFAPDPQSRKAPWESHEGSTPTLEFRPKTDVILRTRERLGPSQPFQARPIARQLDQLTLFEGNLSDLLHWADTSISTNFWVDFDPLLEIGKNGGEIFHDHRYSKADVVFCGYYFERITDEIETWAKEQSLIEAKWQKGQIMKVPKLDGPLTMWRTEFSKELNSLHIASNRSISLSVLLQSLIDSRNVNHMSATASGMGWNVR